MWHSSHSNPLFVLTQMDAGIGSKRHRDSIPTWFPQRTSSQLQFHPIRTEFLFGSEMGLESLPFQPSRMSRFGPFHTTLPASVTETSSDFHLKKHPFVFSHKKKKLFVFSLIVGHFLRCLPGNQTTQTLAVDFNYFGISIRCLTLFCLAIDINSFHRHFKTTRINQEIHLWRWENNMLSPTGACFEWIVTK